jgi:hypothetical protein
MEEQLPPNEYYDYYATVGHKLRVQPRPDFDNTNSQDYLEGLRRTLLQRLSKLSKPSVAFHERAPDGLADEDMQVRLAVDLLLYLPVLRAGSRTSVYPRGWQMRTCRCGCD